ncbi:hypothetical protein, partial [Rickettsiella grylli]|uniref:hypothetical protein n=1 Tax=Rickettsiella grylli TaxID=59196 RepID=UPI000AAF26D6
MDLHRSEQPIEALYKKESDFISHILSDIILEKEGPAIFNKNLLIRLLTLKIVHPHKFKEIRESVHKTVSLIILS